MSYTDPEVANIVETEGLGYAVQHYLDPAKIQNEELAALWTQARDTLNAIEAYLDSCAEQPEE